MGNLIVGGGLLLSSPEKGGGALLEGGAYLRGGLNRGFTIRKFPGGALGYFLGGYVPPGTANWHPVLKKNSPKIDTSF